MHAVSEQSRMTQTLIQKAFPSVAPSVYHLVLPIMNLIQLLPSTTCHALSETLCAAKALDQRRCFIFQRRVGTLPPSPTRSCRESWRRVRTPLEPRCGTRVSAATEGAGRGTAGDRRGEQSGEGLG